MALGERLIEERDRLGFSRADFAEKAGVHLNTQANYEGNKREPGAGYIETLKRLGIDVDYVLFGLPDGVVFECPFRITSGHESALISLDQCRNHASGYRTRSRPPSSIEHRWLACCNTCPKNPIKNRIENPPKMSASDIDGRLLAEIIGSFEKVAAENATVISPEKKAHAIVMLYRNFQAIGHADQKTIEATIKLAAS